jgi:hypothetical protein
LLVMKCCHLRLMAEGCLKVAAKAAGGSSLPHLWETSITG